MFEIEYQSNYILIVSNTNDEIYIICLDEVNPKIVKINTFYIGLDNNQIEEAIKQVLNNSGYDIEFELEEYQQSRLYQILENEKEE